MERHRYFLNVVLIISFFHIATPDKIVEKKLPPDTKDNNSETRNETIVFQKCCKDTELFDIIDGKCNHLNNGTYDSLIPKEVRMSLDSLFLKYTKGNRPTHLPRFAVDWKLSLKENTPTCSSNEEPKYFLSDNDKSFNFGIRISDDKYKNHLITFNEEQFRPEYFQSFCLDVGLNSTSNQISGTVAVTCQTSTHDICLQSACVRSCCPPNHYFRLKSKRCVPMKNVTENHLELMMDTSFGAAGDDMNNKINIKNDRNRINLFGPPICNYDQTSQYITLNYTGYLANSNENPLLLNEDGSIQLDTTGPRYNYTQYCVNHVVEEMNAPGDVSMFHQWPQVKICVPDDIWNQGSWTWVVPIETKVIVPCLMVSIMCLVALVIHELFNPERTRQLFFLMRINAAIMLLIYYIFLVVVKLQGKSHVRSWPITCEVEGIIVQFTYLSVMMWLNAMAFEMWSKFRRLRNISSKQTLSSTNNIGWKNPKYKWYAMYAWGCPAFISIVTILIQNLPEKQTQGLIVPNIGRSNDGKAGTCLIESTWGFLMYIYLVSGSVLVSTLIFFGLFVWNLFFGVWAKDGQDKLQDSEVRRQFNTANLRLRAVVRVFLTLGLVWICDIASWALRWRYGQTRLQVYVFITVFDTISALQGVVIFCLIVFDNQRLDAIRARVVAVKSYFEKEELKSIPRKISSTYISTNNNVISSNEHLETSIKGQCISQDISIEKIKYSSSNCGTTNNVTRIKVGDEV